MKRSFFIKQKIVIILLVFSVVAFAGIIYTLRSSSKLDEEHIILVENSEKIEIKVYNARINLSDYLETRNEKFLKDMDILFTKVYKNISSIELLVSNKSTYKTKPKVKFLVELYSLRENIVHVDSVMHSCISLGNENGLNEAMSDISETFTLYEKALHLYINESNHRLKREIFLLLTSIFLLLAISLILVIRFMNNLIRTHRQLVRNTMVVEQRERKRIAIDLHDGLGALLSSVGMYSKILEKELKEDQKSVEKLNHITQLSRQALDTVGEVINNLNPSVLNRYNLVESLERLCVKINNLNKVKVELQTRDFTGQLPKSTEVVLYRICSELINNTLKHANASEVRIELSGRNVLHLRYADNGDGFIFDSKQAKENGGMGLQNIMERVEFIDGQYEVTTAPGKGFEIRIQFAISKQNN